MIQVFWYCRAAEWTIESTEVAAVKNKVLVSCKTPGSVDGDFPVSKSKVASRCLRRNSHERGRFLRSDVNDYFTLL